MSRRTLLKASAGGAFVIGAGGLLGGCGSSSSGTTSGLSSARKPVYGGTLRAGLSGGGSGDVLDGENWLQLMDASRVWALYDSLLAYDSNALPQLALAEEFTPNKDATQWTIRLKPGITFHNGKPLTADDVIYSFNRIANPKKPLEGAAAIAAVDVAGMKKLDSLTVRVPCHTPYSILAEVQATPGFFIVPVGFDLKKPVGTGPFKFESFTPGQQSTFVRNKNYWQHGLPYVDKLVITDYSDETSQVNALISGQVDLIDLLSAESITAVQSGGAKPLITPGGGYTPFTMRVDQAPFNDIRVVQAFRLIVDRPQMLQLLFNGHGTVANDLFGIWSPDYNHAIPQRTQDLEKAKSLLKQAGKSGLTVELVTAPIASGAVKTAQVFAQQAKGAGVNVKLRQVTSTELFGPNFLKWNFSQDQWAYSQYFPNVYAATSASAPFNECHSKNSAYQALLLKAVATVDANARAQIAHEMQMLEWNGQASGYIIPYFSPNIDAASSKVRGLPQIKTGLPLSAFDYKNIWLA